MDKIIKFDEETIRKVWHNEEWYFSVVDIIKILTNSSNPSDYLKKIRQRDEGLNKGWGQIVTTLTLESKGGKQKTNCVNNKGALRLIQSIPSKRAEPVKLWLAQLGQDRIDEIQNPELGVQRNLEYYRRKGYTEDWIKRRSFSISTRKKLTQEWKERGIYKNNDFAFLTNIIHTGTFDINVKEHKEFKTISKKEELRDHMNDIELALISLSEATTTEITKQNDSEGIDELSDDAHSGSSVGKNARIEVEKKLGKSVVTSQNFLKKD